MSQPIISRGQLAAMLICARCFSLLTFAPRTMPAYEGSVVMLSQLAATVITWILLQPMLLLSQKRDGMGTMEAAFLVNKRGGRLSALVLWLLLVLLGADALAHFQYFLSGAIYPGASPMIFVLLLAAACGYSAAMGVEAVGRMSALVVFAFFISIAAVTAVLLPQARLVNVTSPLFDGARPVVEATVSALIGNADLLVLPVLLPMCWKDSRVPTAWFLFGSLVLYELIPFLTLTVMGQYSRTRLFPVYTLMTIAQVSVFERLDILHLGLWILIALIKVSVYLIAARQMLDYVWVNKGRYSPLFVTIGSTAAAALFATYAAPEPASPLSRMVTGGALLLFAVIIPVVELLILRFGKNGQPKEEAK